MTARLLVWVGVASLVLGGCGEVPEPTPNARIVAFTTSAERVPRGEPVTVSWQAADAGVKDGMFSCVLTRRFDDQPTADTLQAACAGSVTEVPAAPVSAAAVEYRFAVLKQPYDANEPYLVRDLTVTLDAAMYAVHAGGSLFEEVTGVSALADGSAIVAGTFRGTAAFGATTLDSAGADDAFVARVDPDGTWDWATRAGGTSSDYAYSVSALPDGGAIVAGAYFAPATFGATTLGSAPANHAFVARIDADGAWAWATDAGGGNSESARSVSALADGSAVVAGRFTDTTTFGSTTLVSAGVEDAFVARVDPDGAWVWATGGGGTNLDAAQGVAALDDGGAIVVGYFGDTATFGATTLDSAGGLDAFVARVHPDGTWAWATHVGGTELDFAWEVSALPDGGAIVAGTYGGTATFGAITLESAGGADVFVARIRPDGTWAWAARAGGPDGEGAYGVSTLADGGALVAGFFAGTAAFGTTTVESAGGDDAFVARIDPDGTWAWANRAGDTEYDYAWNVDALADGGAVVAGRFVRTAEFGGTVLTGAGDSDAFVARIDASGAW